MSGNTAPEPAAAGVGILQNARALAAACSVYLRARLRLAGLESREAACHFLRIACLVLAGALALLLGYVFGWAALIFLAAGWTGWRWEWFMAAAGIIHVVAALACVLTVRHKLRTPVFEATLEELKRDQQWLESIPTQKPH